ncbi:hypothetical protein ACFLRM_04695 [Acidobacteriota bacterium]
MLIIKGLIGGLFQLALFDTFLIVLAGLDPGGSIIELRTSVDKYLFSPLYKRFTKKKKEIDEVLLHKNLGKIKSNIERQKIYGKEAHLWDYFIRI